MGEIPDFLRSGLSTVSCVIGGVDCLRGSCVVCSEGSSMTDVVVMVLVGFGLMLFGALIPILVFLYNFEKWWNE